MDKRSILEERKKRWMSDREVNMIKEQVAQDTFSSSSISSSASIPATSNSNNSNNSHNSSKAALDSAGTDLFLDKLTQKLTSHIRDHVKREMQESLFHSHEVRDVVVEKMESFLQAELNTHTCKICFELMASPVHTPMLLFPCGHTFCKQCLTSMGGSNNLKATTATSNRTTCRQQSSNCPYCRAHIESSAVNQSLKELIDQFAKQKDMISMGRASQLDDVFTSSNNNNNNNNNNKNNNNSNNNSNSYSSDYDGGYYSNRVTGHHHAHNNNNSNNNNNNISIISNSKEVNRMKSQLQSCEMRFTILSNENEETLQEVATLQKKRRQLDKANNHLAIEKRKLEDKVRLLMEEIGLIDKHLNDQKVKEQELAHQEATLIGRTDLLQSTMNNLREEMDKLSVLVQGVLH